MKRVGSYEAKTRLPGLLREVSRGAQISITRKGIPVALLVPAPAADRPDPRLTIRRLRDLRREIGSIGNAKDARESAGNVPA
jgi:prevent-host-death family protein